MKSPSNLVISGLFPVVLMMAASGCATVGEGERVAKIGEGLGGGLGGLTGILVGGVGGMVAGVACGPLFPACAEGFGKVGAELGGRAGMALGGRLGAAVGWGVGKSVSSVGARVREASKSADPGPQAGEPGVVPWLGADESLAHEFDGVSVACSSSSGEAPSGGPDAEFSCSWTQEDPPRQVMSRDPPSEFEAWQEGWGL